MGEDDEKTVTKTVEFCIEAKSELNPEWRTLPGGQTEERATDSIKWMRKLSKKFADGIEYRLIRVTNKVIKTPIE